LSIQLFGDLRTNHLEERGNDTIQAKSNSDSNIKCTIVQFYSNCHISQSDRWIGLKFYVKSPYIFSYLRLNLQVNRSLGRHHNTSQQRLYEFCYLLPFNYWTSYLARILFLQGYDNLFWESPSSNGWQWFINVSKSFSYNDSLFILATTRKEDFRINSTFKSDFLVYFGLLKGDKFDSSIFRIVIFGFLLFYS
jgi:hypothetical protein